MEGKLSPREVMSPAHSTLVRRLGLGGFQGSRVPGQRPSPAPMCCHLPPGVQAQRGAAGAAGAAGAQQRWALAAQRQTAKKEAGDVEPGGGPCVWPNPETDHGLGSLREKGPQGPEFWVSRRLRGRGLNDDPGGLPGGGGATLGDLNRDAG